MPRSLRCGHGDGGLFSPITDCLSLPLTTQLEECLVFQVSHSQWLTAAECSKLSQSLCRSKE